jgi:hypothetical protein
MQFPFSSNHLSLNRPSSNIILGMDSFLPSQLIEHRIGEFSKELPSLDEIEAFYSLEKVQQPANRPYGWSNTINSLDGVVSIGQGNMGVKLVGLKNLPQAKAKTDFRLLAAGMFPFRTFF